MPTNTIQQEFIINLIQVILAVWGVIVYEPKHIPLKETQRSLRHSHTDSIQEGITTPRKLTLLCMGNRCGEV